MAVRPDPSSTEDVYAVVVWYEPQREYITNLRSYAAHVKGIIVVDNSPRPHEHLLAALPTVSYRWAGENLGIAGALNVGCHAAMQSGAAWMLTMDQDSFFEGPDIHRHLANRFLVPSDVAVLSPGFSAVTVPSGTFAECDSAITSGSLVRASAYAAIGGYNEHLFLDEVDHEFGYRLRKRGYRVLRAGGVFMHHTVGIPMQRTVFGRRIRSTNHPPLRKYYMTRSRLYMRRHFGEFGGEYLKMIMMDALKVVLIEQEKGRKLMYMARGVFDHLRGRGGRLGR